MSVDFNVLATPGIQGLQPYQPGKPIEELQRELGLTKIVKLASNENPLGCSPLVAEAINRALPQLARYPDGGGFELKNALARHCQVAPEQIILGNGSNDVIDLLAMTFLAPGRSAVFSEHGFIVYPIITQAVGARAIQVPAQHWAHDLDAMAAAIEEDTRLVFVANPNNPTGTWHGQAAIEDFLSRVPAEVIVVLDEAYFEYSGEAGGSDGLRLLGRFPNLVVVRTFSKAYGLAGLRVGYSVSGADIAELVNRIREPFNVNSLAMVAAVAALQDQDFVQRSRDINSEGMAQLVAGLQALGLEYIPSAGNFVSVDMGTDAATMYRKLLAEGVIVRPIGAYGMQRHLRISIGLADENAFLLECLHKVMSA